MSLDYDIRSEIIAKIKFKEEDGSKGLGTGFLIDKDILVTAYHNIKSYIESNCEVNIFFNNDMKEKFNIKSIKFSSELFDIAILNLDKSLNKEQYFRFVNFPLTRDGIYEERRQISTLGYIAGRVNLTTFSGKIDSINSESKNIILALDGDIKEDLGGLSGAPIIIKGFNVYGIAIKQSDPGLGKDVQAVTVSNLIRCFIDNNIRVKEFDGYLLIEKEEYKNKLLDRVIPKIENEDYFSLDVKRIMVSGAKFIVRELKEKSVNEFLTIINSISLSKNTKFELDHEYIKYEKDIAKLILQLVILKYTYRNRGLVLTGEVAKSIRINDERVISYLFSLESTSYLNNIINVFRYFNENIEKDMNGISNILIGNCYHKNTCRSYCDNPFEGSKINFEKIISNICDIDDDPFEEKKGGINITNIKNSFDRIKFHCQNCLECSEVSNINEITTLVKNVLGE